MSLKVSFCALMLSASLAAHAETRVRTVPYSQYVSIPDSEDAESPGRVAIYGDFAIVIEVAGSGRQARPYQRLASGQWQAGAPLFMVSTAPRGREDDDVAMGDGLAAIHIGTQVQWGNATITGRCSTSMATWRWCAIRPAKYVSTGAMAR
jgi:hypothetical protein